MQRSAAQFAEAERIADFQLTGRIAEFPRLATIEVELQKTVLFRQAGQ